MERAVYTSFAVCYLSVASDFNALSHIFHISSVCSHHISLPIYIDTVQSRVATDAGVVGILGLRGTSLG